MKIKYIVLTAVLATAVFGFGGGVKAQIAPSIQSFTVVPSTTYPNAYSISWTLQGVSAADLTVSCQQGLTIKNPESGQAFQCGDISNVFNGYTVSEDLQFNNSTSQSITATVGLSPNGVNSMFKTITIPPTSITPTTTTNTNQDTQTLIAQLQAQIQSLMQQLAQLRAQQGTAATWCYTFNSNLGYSSTGSDVSALQTALTKNGFDVSGDASGTYSDATASAVSGFQEKYISDVLSPKHLTHGTGYVGSSTRAKLNTLYGCSQ